MATSALYRIIHVSTNALVFSALLAGGSSASAAGRVQVDGLSLDFSSATSGAWVVTDTSPEELVAMFSRSDGLGEGGAPKAMRAAAQLRRLDHFPLVTTGHLEVARARLIESLQSESDVIDYEIFEMDCLVVGGAPAYRLRSRLETADDAIEQLQFIITGDRAYLLTFTVPDGELDRLRNDLDGLVGTALVARTPVLASMTPAILCALLAAAVKLASGAVRRFALSLSGAELVR